MLTDMEYNIPPCFYRVSVKALVLDETRTKFLVFEEDNGHWEIPGGGLDWGEDPVAGVRREIEEEVGVPVVSIGESPAYVVTFQAELANNYPGTWYANLIYEVELAHHNFTATKEAVVAKFVTPEEVLAFDKAFTNVKKLAKLFDSRKNKGL